MNNRPDTDNDGKFTWKDVFYLNKLIGVYPWDEPKGKDIPEKKKDEDE